MIEVENVGKRFGAKVAVDGVSFVAPPGAVTGFVGPNGAGKSTVLRMIAGLTRPDSGRVTGVSAAAAAGLTFARREP
jgi:ABC-2 type transport system ATP-binding protein